MQEVTFRNKDLENDTVWGWPSLTRAKQWLRQAEVVIGMGALKKATENEVSERSRANKRGTTRIENPTLLRSIAV